MRGEDQLRRHFLVLCCALSGQIGVNGGDHGRTFADRRGHAFDRTAGAHPPPRRRPSRLVASRWLASAPVTMKPLSSSLIPEPASQSGIGFRANERKNVPGFRSFPPGRLSRCFQRTRFRLPSVPSRAQISVAGQDFDIGQRPGFRSIRYCDMVARGCCRAPPSRVFSPCGPGTPPPVPRNCPAPISTTSCPAQSRVSTALAQ